MSVNVAKLQANNLKLAKAAMGVDAAFVAKPAVTVKPSGDGVFDLINNGNEAPEHVTVRPIGTGNAAQTFSLRLIGWSKLPGDNNNSVDLWVPTILAELVCTLSTSVGVAGTPILGTTRFADTITVTSEPTTTANVTRDGATRIFSPANNTPAWAKVALNGCQLLEIIVQTGTASGGNAAINLG